jgi:hypothetical protein
VKVVLEIWFSRLLMAYCPMAEKNKPKKKNGKK